MTRSCGDCRACCTLMNVPSRGKGDGVACNQLCASGCAIYPSRPDECQRFECVWLHEVSHRLIREEDRPDISGVMLTSGVTGPFVEKTGIRPLIAHEVWLKAANEYRGSKLLNRLAKRCFVVVLAGRRERQWRGPPEVIERAREAVT